MYNPHFFPRNILLKVGGAYYTQFANREPPFGRARNCGICVLCIIGLGMKMPKALLLSNFFIIMLIIIIIQYSPFFLIATPPRLLIESTQILSMLFLLVRGGVLSFCLKVWGSNPAQDQETWNHHMSISQDLWGLETWNFVYINFDPFPPYWNHKIGFRYGKRRQGAPLKWGLSKSFTANNFLNNGCREVWFCLLSSEWWVV
jgi:hypothetical protein